MVDPVAVPAYCRLMLQGGSSPPPRVDIASVRAQALACGKCRLAHGRSQVVWADGNLDANLLFIGEAPGFHEDQQGRPFVGAAGQLLDRLLSEIDIDRTKAAIVNVIKCRPPGNRDPLPDEIAACSTYLERQLKAIDPDVVVTLGRFSMAKFFPGERISRIHGQAKKIGRRLVVPMYHPAAALHQAALRGAIEDDFAKLPKLLAEAERERESSAEQETPPDQLQLF